MILPSFHPPLHPPSYPTSIHFSFPPHHPFSTPFHSTSSLTTANIQNHPCYCVTVLLRPFVFTSLPHIPASPHVPSSFSFLMSPPFPSLPPLLPHILSYSLSRPFVFAQIYIRSRAPAQAPSHPYFAPFRTRNAKNPSPSIRFQK